MKFLKISLLLVLIFIVAGFVGLIATGYYLVSEISQTPKLAVIKAVEENQKLTDITSAVKTDQSNVLYNSVSEYSEQVKYFDFIDGVQEKIRSQNVNSICEIMCTESRLDKQKLKFEKLEYLKQFFTTEQNRAFDDIEFRIFLEEASMISDLIPQDIRNLVFEIDEFSHFSEADKILFVARAEFQIMRYSRYINSKYAANKRHARDIGEIKKLRKQCEVASSDDLKQSCYNLVKTP